MLFTLSGPGVGVVLSRCRLPIFKPRFFHKGGCPGSSMVNLKTENYGYAKGGEVTRCTWTTRSGFSVTAISYGALITHIIHPDRNGQLVDINLGFDHLNEWVGRNVAYFGAPIGRVANRIGDATFCLDGQQYCLNKNQGQNSLHGGIVGFDKVLWKTSIEGTKVVFSYLSCDGEEGYPGNVIVNLSYDVTDDDTLHVEFFAVSDQPTLFNMTHHAYLNLAGHQYGPQGIYEMLISINADRYTETDLTNVPTGRILSVSDTPFDLRIPRKMGDLIVNNPKLFDCNFCINSYGGHGHEGGPDMRFVARASHPPSGRFIEIHSDQPGLQLYTGNNLPTQLDPPIPGKGGVCYQRHGAFCLETQNYPDAINHSNFPSPILRPSQVYRHRVTYLFGADKTPPPPPPAAPSVTKC